MPRSEAAASHCNRGAALLQQDRPDEAAAAFGRALALMPGLAEAHSNLGVARAKQGRSEEAVAAFRRAVALRPDWAEAHANLGAALREQGDLAAAADACRRVVGLRPDDATAQFHLGAVLLAQERLGEAAAAFARVVALAPDRSDGHTNLGVAQARQGNVAEAVAAFRCAVGLRGDLPEAHLNLGQALRLHGDVAGSIAAYRRALALRPDYPEARFGLSLNLLAVGAYEEGWREYEWRWQGGADAVAPPSYPWPRWEGQDVAAKRVLVWAEQGFGDALQFVRYVPALARRGARVAVGAPPPLLALFRRLEGAAALFAPGDALPEFDYHCPVMSLPLAFGTRVDTIPAPIPYLRGDPGKAAAWRRRLEGAPGLRVGLVWAGNPRATQPEACAIDRRRSIVLARLAPLAAVPGVAFVSLQKGEAAAQTRSPPPGLAVHDWSEELADFDDTAALIAALDLVIGVDTAVVHLAGALGKPVWLLNRFDTCWRWLLGRDDSPWYPSLRQFRQPAPGDWDSVLAAIGAALTRLTAR